MISSLVVIEPCAGATERLGQAIARGLRGAGDAHVVNVLDMPDRLDPISLLVIGGPGHCPRIRAWLRSIETAARNWRVSTFEAVSATAAERERFQPVRGVVSSVGIPLTQRPTPFAVYGPRDALYPGELQRAEEWGRSMLMPA